jgi:4-aminobutyrate aminotransferase-like enzyme
VTIPGHRSQNLSQRLKSVESRNITYLSKDFPVFWESAAGASVRDADGNSFIDLTAAFGVAGLGHGHKAIRKAMASQAAKLWHGMGDVHPSKIKVELLELLAEITPGRLQKTILSSSGAEAVESALKTAHLFTEKPGVLAFEGAYHGLTYGALAATHREDFSAPFRDQLAPFVAHAPYPDALRGPDEAACLRTVEEVLQRSRGKIGAILVEPMQARGGIRIPKPSFLKGLRKLATQHKILLIVDEIYTGFGRTGTLFATQQSGIVPDLLCLGKALANGYPISACIGTARVMDAWPASDGEAIHTSTFLGNPLGCAMAVASIRETQRLKLDHRSKAKGAAWLADLKEALDGHPHVGEIRGVGLMIGIELVKNKQTNQPNARLAGRLIGAALQKGLILLSGGNCRNVLTLTPPLTISQRDLNVATLRLKEIVWNL